VERRPVVKRALDEPLFILEIQSVIIYLIKVYLHNIFYNFWLAIKTLCQPKFLVKENRFLFLK
jgi:hypothetical protein